MSNNQTILTVDDLQLEKLLATASSVTGLNDYGDRDFVKGLSIFLDDLRTEAGLNNNGVAAQFQDLVRLLSNRLGFQRDLKEHPEILDEVIEKPIIIIGLPRSGTSKLQRMISADPDVQRLEMWRLQFPAPLANTAGIKPDPRIALSQEIEAMLTDYFPDIMARHPMEAKEPDEELWLLEMTFETSMASLKTRAPKHREWIKGRSMIPAYRYMRSLLQYLQWQDGGARGRPWIMKAVTHTGELPTLLEIFPDATIVQCHRDPTQLIPSFTSLLEVSRLSQCDHVNLNELGADFTHFWASEANRNIDARQAISKEKVIDVYYEDIRDNPENVIAKIYQHAGRTITPQAKQAFSDYANRRPAGHFGAHRYTMERYGLNQEKIETAFANYLDYFPKLQDRNKH